MRARSRARSIAERLGMTVLLERMAPPAGEWRLTRDGNGWLLDAGGEHARCRYEPAAGGPARWRT